MSAGIIVAIVVAVVVVAALVIGLTASARRRRLRQRFGPEYDRLVGERDSKRKAETELTERERRVRDLDIRPLTESARAGYVQQWATLQEQFVDMPADAVAASQVLVAAVMNERGYPTGDSDQVLADLSVEHAKTLGHFRAAEEISKAAVAGTASTEDLRQAMIHYRELFRELLGEPAGSADMRNAGRPAQDRAAEDRTARDGVVEDQVARDRVASDTPAEDQAARDRVASDTPAEDQAARDRVASDAPAEETWAPVSADEPVSNRQADSPVQRAPRS